MQPLIRTKFFIPALRDNIVPRPQLLEKIALGAQKALTLICAPAGYGKTTLLAAWIAAVQRLEAATKQAICWVSLDPDDNDPVRFLSYLTASLEQIRLQLSPEIQELLCSGDVLQPQTPLSILVNELQELNQPVWLVLDDYQFIRNTAIHDGMLFLIEHLPQHMHVMIATRSDPPLALSRLRACNALGEIRAEDLRFSLDETAAFLKNGFRLVLSDDQIRTLGHRTEGWIAGLQLAGVSLQGRADPAYFIEAFSGSHRFIMDYLTEEALSRQPESIQHFLLQTSILDRMNDALCAFLMETDEAPFHAADCRLGDLESRGLFLVPQDDERVWYRYHHLFADLLRARLQAVAPQSIPLLHRQASCWFEDHGFLEEAIQHALAAADWQQAGRLIVEQMPSFLENGQMSTVMTWLDRFPQQKLLGNPVLCVQAAEMYAQAGRIDQIDPLLDKAEAILNAKSYEPDCGQTELSSDTGVYVRSMAAILRGLKAVCSGCPSLALELTQTALVTVPEMQAKELAVLYWVQGWAYRSLSDLQQSLKLLTRATTIASASGKKLRDIWTDLGNVTRLAGKLPQAIEILTNSLQKAQQHGDANQGNLSRDEAFLSYLYYEQNHLELAYSYANRALVHTRWWPSHNIIAMAYVSLAWVALARADLSGARQAMQAAEKERADRLMTPFVHSLIENTWPLIWLKEDRRDQLETWEQDTLHRVESPCGLDEYQEMRLTMLIRVGMERTRQDKKRERYQLCLQHSARVLESSHSSGRGNTLVAILLYRALLFHLTGRFREAFAELAACFSLAEPAGYVRIFLDAGESAQLLIAAYLQESSPAHAAFAQSLLVEFERLPSAKPHPKGLQEVLTTREIEILKLLTEGCSNREMANRLFLSEGTIKFHVHHILEKLNASSRTQAIAKAKTLNPS
jgi:LuxR family maltose regulon positive regulatory protein